MEYTVYDPKTTLPIAFGTIEECIETLGISRATFVTAAHLYRKGRYKKYIIIREDGLDVDSEERDQDLYYGSAQ